MNLKDTRRKFVPNTDLESRQLIHFINIPSISTQTSSLKKRKSSDFSTEFTSKLMFELDPNKEIRTPLLKFRLEQLRHRLVSLLTDIKSIAELEEVTPKEVASLCLILNANEEKDYTTIGVCKEIVERGTYGKLNNTSLSAEIPCSYGIFFQLGDSSIAN